LNEVLVLLWKEVCVLSLSEPLEEAKELLLFFTLAYTLMFF